MNDLVFVDTGGWFASIVPWDANHDLAKNWLAQNNQTLLTTDSVLSETLTLLRIRGERERAIWLGEKIWSEELAVLYMADREDQLAAWDVFRRFADKDWSFVDCLSKVVMERLEIDTAFSFDHHFRQFGNVQVTP